MLLDNEAVSIVVMLLLVVIAKESVARQCCSRELAAETNTFLSSLSFFSRPMDRVDAGRM